jgi:glycerol uptake facilitator-like aquaporin
MADKAGLSVIGWIMGIATVVVIGISGLVVGANMPPAEAAAVVVSSR